MKAPVYFLALLTVLLLVGCATHEQQLMEKKANALDQNDLERFFARERTADFETKRGTQGTVTYHPDKTMELRIGKKEDSGTYRLVDSRFCSTWQNIRKGEKCTRLYHVAGNTYETVTDSGAYDATLKFMP